VERPSPPLAPGRPPEAGGITAAAGPGPRAWLRGLQFSLKASNRARRPVWIRRRGDGLWLHRWRGGALVLPAPSKLPLEQCRASIPLFTRDYQPRPGDTIVDVGAGVGTELQAFSEMVGPQGRVVAIEADPAAYRCLEALRSVLRLPNVALMRRAVGAVAGTAWLTQDAEGAASNALGAAASDRAVEVAVTTLDLLVAELAIERIDLLKMNIEGGEVGALQGFQAQRGLVRHWCISCHDFLGTPEGRTLDLVSRWLAEEAGMAPRRHPEVPGSPWMGCYLFAG